MNRIEAHLSTALDGIHIEVLRLQAPTLADIDLDMPDLLMSIQGEGEELKPFDREARHQIQ